MDCCPFRFRKSNILEENISIIFLYILILFIQYTNIVMIIPKS